MSTAIILPQKERKGCDSSRVIAVSHADCSGRPELLVTREFFEGQYVLRFPGGKEMDHKGESPHGCATRELEEETGYLESDSDTGLIYLFPYTDRASNHTTHIFICGFRQRPRIRVHRKVGNVSSRHWIPLSCLNMLGAKYLGPHDCPMEKKHLKYLRKSVDSYNILGELLSCYTSKRRAKRAS